MQKKASHSVRQKARHALRRWPIVGNLLHRIRHWFVPPGPIQSTKYWVDRYHRGGNSGIGSYGKLAEFKAEVLNQFVAEHDIANVIEFGCGDGNQLKLAVYPSYIGMDVSADAIEHCRAHFLGDTSKEFRLLHDHTDQQADLALSLDVIYHLIEDTVFEQHMRMVFGAARRYVAIYSTNFYQSPVDARSHVRHRQFTDLVEHNLPTFRLLAHLPNPHAEDPENGSKADFFMYEVIPSIEENRSIPPSEDPSL